jgi:hypothetical protein
MKTLSRILLPSTNPVWFGLIMPGRKACSLLARALARILYMLPNKVIGLQFPSLERSPVLGIKVIRPLLMKAEASPEFNMAV